MAPETEIRTLLTVYPSQEWDSAAHVINACLAIGVSQLAIGYSLFRGVRIGLLRKKRRHLRIGKVFYREVSDSCSRLSQRDGAIARKITWKNFALMAYKQYLSLSLKSATWEIALAYIKRNASLTELVI